MQGIVTLKAEAVSTVKIEGQEERRAKRREKDAKKERRMICQKGKETEEREETRTIERWQN